MTNPRVQYPDLYRISAREIEALRPEAFVDLMNHLLWAEGHRVGIAPTEIQTTLRVNEPDQGVDARIGSAGPGSRWIPEGVSVWQFKSGRMGPATIRKEYKKRGVQNTVRQGGTYFFVISKDLPPTRLDVWHQVLDQCFREDGLVPKGRVLAAGQIAEWASEHPSMVFLPYLARPVHGDLMRWETWSRQQRFQQPFKADAQREKIISESRRHLSGRGDLLHLRIEGLAGVGKTRLALEICREEGLRERVLYAEHPDHIPAGLFHWLQNHSAASLILVVDECDPHCADRLAHYVEACDGRVRLLTIGQAREPQAIRHYPPHVFLLERLGEQAMRELLEAAFRKLPREWIEFVLRISSGYVKLAVAIAIAVSQNSQALSVQDMVRSYDVKTVLDQFIVPDEHDRRTMQAIALFSRIGWEENLASEGEAVARFLGLDWADAQMRAKRLVDQGLIARQGRYRYVTPHLLAVWLASEVWEARKEEVLSLLESLPTSSSCYALLQRLRDLGDEPQVQQVCKMLLGPDGLFKELDDLNEVSRSQLFAMLAEAYPVAAVRALERILGHLPRDELLRLREGRRYIVWALEKLAWLPETFFNAARLLLALAEAENEAYANNATGVWVGLFGTHLGGTAVPAVERHSLIAEALESPSFDRQLLAVKAIQYALCTFETRPSEGEYHCGRLVPPEWHPRNADEDRAVRKSALALLDRALASHEPKVRQAAEETLLYVGRALVRMGLTDDLLKRLARLQTDDERKRHKMREVVEAILEFDGAFLHPEQRETFIRLRNDLAGASFHDRLRRWVGRWTISDWKPGRVPGTRSPEEEAAALADEAMRYPDLLKPELEWLASPEAQNIYFFARRLGELDLDMRWWGEIEALAYQGKGFTLAAAYLQGLVDAGHKEYRDSILERWAQNPAMAEPLLEAIWRGTPDDQDAQRLTSVIEKGWLSPAAAAKLVLGGQTKHFSRDAFCKLVGPILRSRDEQAARSALSLIHSRLHHHPDDEEELEPLAWIALEKALPPGDAMSQYEWIQVARFYAAKDPIRIVRLFLSLFGTEGAPLSKDDPFTEVLIEVTRLDPEGVWEEIERALLEKGRKAFLLYLYLRGWYAALFEPAFLLKRAEERQGQVPGLIAQLTPPMDGESLHPLARALIIRFNQEKEVLSALSANFLSGIFFGSLAHWLEERLRIAREWAKDPHPAIQMWARQLAEDLENRIPEAKRREEEEGW